MTQSIIKRIKLSILSVFMIAATVSALPTATVAAQPTTTADPCARASIVAFPHWYDNGLCKDGKIVAPKDIAKKLPNDANGILTFVTILATNIVTIILMVVGYVSLAFIIWGGFKYMYSGDNASGTTAAKQTILNAVIGLVLSIMSVAIIKAVAGAIQ